MNPDDVDQRVRALAREAARVRGTSEAAVIEEALQMLLRAHSVDPQAVWTLVKIETARRIVEAYLHPPARPLSITRVEDLYDDASGLPL